MHVPASRCCDGCINMTAFAHSSSYIHHPFLATHRGQAHRPRPPCTHGFPRHRAGPCPRNVFVQYYSPSAVFCCSLEPVHRSARPSPHVCERIRHEEQAHPGDGCSWRGAGALSIVHSIACGCCGHHRIGDPVVLLHGSCSRSAIFLYDFSLVKIIFLKMLKKQKVHAPL